MKKVMRVLYIIIVIIGIIGYITFSNMEAEDNNQNNKKNEQTNNGITNNTENNNIQSTIGDEEKMPKLNIKIGDNNFTAILYDNETTRELIKQMPLTIKMNELNGNEKYYYFPQNLPTNTENIGSIKTGDLMLYGSDCLVLFYKDFSTSYSYTKLGHIDNPEGLANAVGSGNIEISISINE